MFGFSFHMIRTALAALLMCLGGAILLAFGATVVRAAEAESADTIYSQCWASGSLAESLSAISRKAERWDCSHRPYSLDGERIFLRFDVAGAQIPRYFVTRRAALEAIHFLTIDKNGTERATSLPKSQWLDSNPDSHMRIPVTDVRDDSQYFIVAFDRASHRMTLDGAYLTALEDSTDTRTLLFLAALCGMLAMPLVFNAAFYRVLREDFVLWHSMLVITLLLTVLVSSGLAMWWLTFPVMTLSWMQTVLFGASVAAGCMFSHGFIEPGRLHPILRRALVWCAVSAMTLSALHALFPYVARPVQSTLYTAAFIPIMLVFIAVLIDAASRGSRAVIFQIIGWAPMVVVGIIRLVTGLVPSLESNDAMSLFYIGCVFEAICTAMGVADRFMSLKDQRDRARTEAEILEGLAERDALTGLLNRRGFENRAEALFAQGFRTLAVLDLDHFKAINDSYGHAVGDRALQAAAQALRPNARVEVFRMGGEEFVMLLRGKDAHAQAERRRMAIPDMIGETVPQLKRRVTASMGVVDMAADSVSDRDIGWYFERADELLYQAKQQGRDRAIWNWTNAHASGDKAALFGNEPAAVEYIDVRPERRVRHSSDAGSDVRSDVGSGVPSDVRSDTAMLID